MGTVSGLARSGVRATAVLWDRVRPPADGIVVLLYHRVGAGTGRTTLSPSVFEAQIARLAASHRVLDLDTAAAELAAGVVAGPGVVVTFDDGTPDWVEEVLPVLERHRVPATFFVATASVEDGTLLPDGAAPISWAGLAELRSTGLATIGSHTHTHALMDRVPPHLARDELDRSVGLIEERLGCPARHFAYPKALPPSPEVEPLVVERFDTASLAGCRPNPPGADLHRLARSPILADDGDRWFRAKAAGGLRLEAEVRTLVDRVRYRGAQA